MQEARCWRPPGKRVQLRAIAPDAERSRAAPNSAGDELFGGMRGRLNSAVPRIAVLVILQLTGVSEDDGGGRQQGCADNQAMIVPEPGQRVTTRAAIARKMPATPKIQAEPATSAAQARQAADHSGEPCLFKTRNKSQAPRPACRMRPVCLKSAATLPSAPATNNHRSPFVVALLSWLTGGTPPMVDARAQKFPQRD